MAHPRSKQSKTRSRKRRTHYKLETPQVAVCSKTGESHLYHRAYWYEGSLFYKGKLVFEKDSVV